MEKKKIIIVLILAVIFLITGIFYYLVWKKIVKNPFVPNSPKTETSQTKPQTEPQFHQSDVEVQSIDLVAKTITGEILLVSKDFSKGLQKDISLGKNDLIKKKADLKVNSDTVFSDISLESIKPGDHIIVETKENLFNYTEGVLDLSSIKKR